MKIQSPMTRNLLHSSARRRAALAALATALVGFSLLFSLAFGSDHEELDAQPSAPPSPFRTDVPSWHEDWYDDALELPDVSWVQGLAREAFGPRYADMWIDRDVSPSVYRVGVVDATPADAETLSELVDGNPRITVVSRTYSKDQLENWQQVIADIAQAHRDWRWTIGADPILGKVVVEVTPIDPTLRSEIEAAGVPPDAFTIEPGGGATAG